MTKNPRTPWHVRLASKEKELYVVSDGKGNLLEVQITEDDIDGEDYYRLLWSKPPAISAIRTLPITSEMEKFIFTSQEKLNHALSMLGERAEGCKVHTLFVTITHQSTDVDVLETLRASALRKLTPAERRALGVGNN